MNQNLNHNQNQKFKMDVKGLLAIAHDKSETGRHQLACELSSIYRGTAVEVQGKKLTESEIGILNQILRHLLDVAQLEIRKMLAEDLATIDTLPIDLVMKLACDEIPIARPILENSPILKDPNLIEVALKMGREHQISISKRRNISEELANALIEAGDATVVQNVLDNESIFLSPPTFETVVDMACEEPSLQPSVIKRPEMNSAAASKLYWWASQEIKKSIMKHYPIDSETLNKSIDVAIQKLVDNCEPSKTVVSDRQKDLARKMTAAQSVNSDFLIQLLRMRQYALFKYVFSLYVRLTEAIVTDVIDDVGGKRLALICKAMLFEKSRFATLFLLARSARTGEHVVDPNELNHTLKYFEKINRSEAEKILESWRQSNQSYWAAA